MEIDFNLVRVSEGSSYLESTVVLSNSCSLSSETSHKETKKCM